MMVNTEAHFSYWGVSHVRLCHSFSGLQTKIPPLTLSNWEARGPFPKLRSYFQVTTPCRRQNVSKRQRFPSLWQTSPVLTLCGSRIKTSLGSSLVVSENHHEWAERTRRTLKGRNTGDMQSQTQLWRCSDISIPMTDSGIMRQPVATATQSQGFSL